MSEQRRNPSYGRGIHVIEDHLEGVSALELKTRLLALFQSPQYEPPLLPTVALELVQLTRKPNANTEDIVHMLESEPMLAAKLLKLAQSALHATPGPIRSLEQVVVRLGIPRTADFFLQAALEMRVFRAPGYQKSMNQLRLHSGATAELARLICRETTAFDEYAFMCGLLHDVGFAACLLALSENRGKAPLPSLEDSWATLKEIHEASAMLLVRLWKLPQEIGLVLGHHHNFVIDSHPHPVAAVVYLADGLAQELGFGFEQEHSDEFQEKAVQSLGLSLGALSRIRTAGQEALHQAE